MLWAALVLVYSDLIERTRTNEALPVVGTTYGSLRGERLYPSWSRRHFHVFRGVPYAREPQGAYQFQPPVEPASWIGTRNATIYEAGCLQPADSNSANVAFSFRKMRRSEDCLYMNIYAPAPRLNETYAVMVWIHGGGFQFGSPMDYREEPILRNFVSRDVIFITIGYRLGPLGFLSTNDDIIPGNNGLWDMIMALRWIRDNIRSFEGNPKAITIMGQGSGAAAASLLTLSPKTEGLIHRQILSSGTGISPGVVRHTAYNATWRLQEHLGCRAFNSSQILECLRQKAHHQLLDATRPRIYFDDYEEWVPVVDGYFGVLPDRPEILAALMRNPLPTLLGTTAQESALQLLLIGKSGINMTSEYFPETSANYLVENLTYGYQRFVNHDLIYEGCRHEYVRKRLDPEQQGSKHLKEAMLDMYSQFWYHSPAAKLAEHYAREDVPVYLYSFDHVSKSLFSPNLAWQGAFHGSDLIYLFDFPLDSLTTGSRTVFDRSWQVDQHVTEILADLYTNFAKFGTPTPPGSPYANWTTFNPDLLNYYSINDRPSMKLGFHWSGCTFWNEYVPQLEKVDIGNLRYIDKLRGELGDYQVATWSLLASAVFFGAVLVGLACYCMRKDSDEEENL